ncbi:MAG TPA: response regulator [Acidimicrobiales bacterium]|nr:response regulator [Acidimicrobiales bacterium]
MSTDNATPEVAPAPGGLPAEHEVAAGNEERRNTERTRTAPEATSEAERLAMLGRYDILDTDPEPAFDRLVRLAARYYDVPMAFVTLVDEQRQWFKSCIGLSGAATPRTESFCTHVVDVDDVVVVADAAQDDRFSANPSVTGHPHLRFYAGAPLRTADGFVLGVLAIADVVPRRPPPDLDVLVELAAIATDELEVIDFDLRSAIEDVAGLLAERAHAKGLELVTLMPPTVPAAVRGDPGRLRQVLLNLVANALKFTDAGEVVVRVEPAEQVDADEVALRISVSDTGIGIPPDQQTKLFAPFSQADASTTRRFGGTGLGLTICSRLVALMGGEMGVESTPGMGSTFWFTVRLAPGDAAPSRADYPHRGLAGLRALVVDDNDTVRRLLDQTLRHWQVAPAEAPGGMAALKAMRSAVAAGEPYDMAILDYHMPDMDGLELARAIRSDSALAATPLVVFTSSARPGDARKAAEAGVQAFLTKPIKECALHQALAAVMSLDPVAKATAPLVTRFGLTEAKGASRARILVAEDNTVNQKVAVRVIEKLGYRADVAANGQEALVAVTNARYDAVLMDCQMPEMDGYQATQAIRAAEVNERIPIVAMMAGAMSWERERAMAAGMDDFLTKPVRMEDLAATLERWLGEGGEGSDFQAGDAVLDGEVVAEIRALDPNGFSELMNGFLSSGDAYVLALQKAAVAKDTAAVLRLAHALKGSSATFGARRLARRCAELEDAVGDWQAARDLADCAAQELAAARGALAAMVADDHMPVVLSYGAGEA